jgi:hypothetical protein
MSTTKLFYLFLSFFFLVNCFPAHALNPGSYLFRFKNPLSSTPSSTTTSQIPFNQPSTLNYQLTPGFPEVKIISDFNFTISDISVDFGILTPETPSKRNQTLSVSAPNTRGYSILAYQNHPLQLSSANAIPNWTSSDSYGFGYSLDNQSFQAFPDQSQNQPPQTIISSHLATITATIINYQVNIPPTQAAGDYENTIYFLALPAY